MFRQKTTIIVGAGASCEIGLPSGNDLKEQIVTLLHRTQDNAYGFSDETMQNIMRHMVGGDVFSIQSKIAPFTAAAEKILRGLPLALSIDNFLHSHQHDEQVVELGKLAIAICILRAERRSHLFEPVGSLEAITGSYRVPTPSIKGKGLQKTWYPAFARLLMSGVQRSNIGQSLDSVSFVVFNYDRCLEHFIWMAIQDYFDVDGDEASTVLDSVQFSHPYGSLGLLPWRGFEQTSLPLGGGDGLDYWKIGGRLKTFTETVRSQMIDSVTNSVGDAETILILGFGYLDQNLQLLTPGVHKRAQRVISTAYGISEPDQKIMRQAMLMLGNQALEASHIEPGTCRDLFNHYHLLLSLS